jgi:hypothetical protein
MVFVSFAKAPGPDTCSSELRVLSQNRKSTSTHRFPTTGFQETVLVLRDKKAEKYI